MGTPCTGHKNCPKNCKLSNSIKPVHSSKRHITYLKFNICFKLRMRKNAQSYTLGILINIFVFYLLSFIS